MAARHPRDCEVFVGTFRDTIRATRTKFLKGDTPSILPKHMYGLEPLDPRLHWGTLTNPTPDDILAQLQRANDLGYEGLVLRQGDRLDQDQARRRRTTSPSPASSRVAENTSAGLGYVKTAKGDVGSGFTDTEREFLWAEAKAERLVGQVIEVSCMQFTPDGQFRHPFFVRMRPDKLAA